MGWEGRGTWGGRGGAWEVGWEGWGYGGWEGWGMGGGRGGAWEVGWEGWGMGGRLWGRREGLGHKVRDRGGILRGRGRVESGDGGRGLSEGLGRILQAGVWAQGVVRYMQPGLGEEGPRRSEWNGPFGSKGLFP